MDDCINLSKYAFWKILQYPFIIYFAIKSYFTNRVVLPPNNIKIENEYRGQKILLIALYEKDVLRPDIKRFLSVAKRAGLYVIGVNTATISETLNDFFDCYIERANVGRDFGSYKTGFEYVFSKRYDQACPRLLMVNDSVYYESTRADQFLSNMLNTDMEVLGATENFEINHHLGSFCISIAGRILQCKRFKLFWKEYQNTELRLVAIVKGEAALSANLRQCVSSMDKWGAFYNQLLVDQFLQKSSMNISDALRLARRGDYPAWPNIHVDKLWAAFLSVSYLGAAPPLPSGCYQLDVAKQHIRQQLKTPDDQLAPQLTHYVIGYILDIFRVGSQIHNSNALLMHLGLPIVKLDSIHRGMFSKEDITILQSLMPPEEGLELENLLVSKPFWRDHVKDWRRWLFILGIH